VRVNGRVARASRLPAARELIEVELPAERPPRELTPHLVPLTVVYEDDHLLVIDKPGGLVVHPAPGHWDDTLVNALAARGTSLAAAGTGRPGIVHRLDRDTSGLMVVARTDLAHRRLGAALAARRISRAYAVLAWGHLDVSPTVVEAPIARGAGDRKRMTVRSDGRAARTDLFRVARYGECELLRAELHSGRTHQIRVHLAHIGHPVVGDPVYGGGGARRISGPGRPAAERLARATPRQALHAAELVFEHPITGRALGFRSEWPADLAPALEAAQGASGHVAPPQALTYLAFFRT
jgi:23S rRNA pseudouridine1911/1915/1917 synthase